MSLTVSTVPAPHLVNLIKTAGVSLEKHGLTGQQAAVYLVLDHSGSMEPYYRSGDVQRLAEQALGLSANLDDDGTVPMLMFGSDAGYVVDLDLTDYAGTVENHHRWTHWGSTNYADAMRTVVAHYTTTGATAPALVIFQTDGEPDSRRDAEHILRESSGLPIFWAFVGFGGRVSFLEQLDTLANRVVDNASFFHASNPRAVSDAELYDGITSEFAQWLPAARRVGVIS
ncbi:VWA domain-containing protein [Streptomyces sp. CB03911]|uniref:VWA domain-containing protein n=1 Tax=Streptomyces sp. CB03911 TaxID=1804758 RepID=UPI00093E22DF|nr:VWA domain-containing protein [Streptomyces sp. CB03911]OKI19288.1 toxic cation resistance protein [Streptomyces sp. CB03911]